MAVSLKQLVESFAHHTAAQTEAIWKGDAKTGNKHAKQRVSASKKLCTHGNAGRDALTVLFRHPGPDVRSMAAAYLLRYRTQEAIAVLEEVARVQGLIAFEARQSLKRWEEGTWTIDAE